MNKKRVLSTANQGMIMLDYAMMGYVDAHSSRRNSIVSYIINEMSGADLHTYLCERTEDESKFRYLIRQIQENDQVETRRF